MTALKYSQTEITNLNHRSSSLLEQSFDLSREASEAALLLERFRHELERLNKQLSGLFVTETAVDDLTRLLPRQAALERITNELPKHIARLKARSEAIDREREEIQRQISEACPVVYPGFSAKPSPKPEPPRGPSAGDDWRRLREYAESLIQARQAADRSLAICAMLASQSGGELALAHSRAAQDVQNLRSTLTHLHSTLSDESVAWRGPTAEALAEVRSVAEQLRQMAEAHSIFAGQLCSTFMAQHHTLSGDAGIIKGSFEQFADYGKKIAEILNAGRLEASVKAEGKQDGKGKGKID